MSQRVPATLGAGVSSAGTYDQGGAFKTKNAELIGVQMFPVGKTTTPATDTGWINDATSHMVACFEISDTAENRAELKTALEAYYASTTVTFTSTAVVGTKSATPYTIGAIIGDKIRFYISSSALPPDAARWDAVPALGGAGRTAWRLTRTGNPSGYTWKLDSKTGYGAA